MTIYKSEKGKNKILALYDKQLERLTVAHSDKWVSTSFGETHLIETGNMSGIPLLVFHGGNATTAYNLLACDFLMKNFHIYAIGYKSICCFGGSFGAGIICKTMCVAPEKIKCAVLYVPSGIKNAPLIHSMRMMFPMMMYWITHEEAGMPSDVAEKFMKQCKAPTLVMAAEKDCLFPAKGVLPRAKQIIENVTTYLLEGRGHMSSLTEDEKQMIVEFLRMAHQYR